MIKKFPALGGYVTIEASGKSEIEKVEAARKLILDLEKSLTRFDENSELSQLNQHYNSKTPVNFIMLKYLEAVILADDLSEGLVDSTLLKEINNVGYSESFTNKELDNITEEAFQNLLKKVPISPAHSCQESEIKNIVIDKENRTVTKPPSLLFDSGGIGKGLAADLSSECLTGLDYFSVDCSGDIKIGGTLETSREVFVTYPSSTKIITRLDISKGAVATSGISRRSWINSEEKLCHHLLDPSTEIPAFTGIIQVTAIAPTAVEAETRAKSMLLSGSDCAPSKRLPYGGIIVYNSGEIKEIL